VADDPVSVRIAENESRFRLANEQIEATAERMGILDPIPFMCECPRDECSEIARLSLDEYEEVRQHPTYFFTVPGHQDIAVEAGAGTEVASNDRYVVVDKIGVAGDVARARYDELSTADPPQELS